MASRLKQSEGKEEHKNLEEKMIVKMEQGFKNEQNARQLVQSEIAQGIQERRECEMKEEIKNLKMGTGSRVCSEASTGVGLGSRTFARRPLLSFW